MNEMNFEAIVSEYKRAGDYTIENKDKILEAGNEILNSIKSGNKILIFGNGGSAADAQHMAAELIGRFEKNRKSYPAIALTTDTSIITAVANDFGYNEIFAKQVQGLAKEGDVLFGITTSGNSENVIKAFEEGKKLKTFNISLTGKKGGEIKDMSDLNINVELESTARVQEGHHLIYHIICKIIEDGLE